MTRSRVLLALLIAVALGLAAGWIAKQIVLPERQERSKDAAVEVQKQLHGGPAPPRQ